MINESHPPTDSNWEEEFIEKGADLEHQRWAKWQKYMHSKILPSAYDEIMEIGTELINHWNRQINTPYSELTEKEKESDRAEVKQYLPLIRNLIQLEREKEREKMIEEIKKKWNCHQVGCDWNRNRVYGNKVCDMNCNNVLEIIKNKE